MNVKKTIRKGSFVKVMNAPTPLKKYINKIGVVEGQFTDFRVSESGHAVYVGFYVGKGKKGKVEAFAKEDLRSA